MALESTQALIEMITKNLPGVKGRQARKADNLTTICEPIVYRKCEILDVSQCYRSSRPVTGLSLPLPSHSVCMLQVEGHLFLSYHFTLK
jgi:hypothetical protein